MHDICGLSRRRPGLMGDGEATSAAGAGLGAGARGLYGYIRDGGSGDGEGDGAQGDEMEAEETRRRGPGGVLLMQGGKVIASSMYITRCLVHVTCDSRSLLSRSKCATAIAPDELGDEVET